MRYAVVFEKAESNYSAYVPDLPACITTGKTIEDTRRLIREAIEFHIDGLREDGEPLPEPSSQCEYVEVRATQPLSR
jgi:predicted RNase H-like HicB family nuclease